MKQLTSLILFFLVAFSATAQTTPCDVAVDALKGTYEGECTKGKANGEGTATGTDTYKGTFKNGYPEGTGKYTWKNGDYFYGKWKKGVKEGKGEMHTFVAGNETVKVGFWKKDEYKGEYENPYKIYNTTNDINRVQVTRVGADVNSIKIEVTNAFNSGNSMESATQRNNSAYAKLTDIQINTGNYMSKTTSTLTNKEVTLLQEVIFPFKAILYFGTGTYVDIEIFEKGNWVIEVPINK